MTTLAIRLAAPLQSWGSSSRFARRTTDSAPTKSGVIGLLAAAQGRRRTDSLEDLVGLRFGVRIDQPGRLTRDFQTARSLDGRDSMPLTYRFYLSDAVFLAIVEGEESFLDAIVEALRRPVFPLYLGRRSCPPAGPLNTDLADGTIEETLETAPWAAATWFQKRTPETLVRLETVVDCAASEPSSMSVRDQPVSFDPERRTYTWRSVLRGSVDVVNPAHGVIDVPARLTDHHEPMKAW